ncbi:biopolymer transporter ExbD [Wolinella succinogenes]|uniref:EXBD\TOLR FAMILY TRANSPORT PROTEIN n=1 Tax=Wolinella succinogenes (strain ATCC 29543 / DSM 1740 / CCUG 13145 / JCM 31913 / LMG 7466 / NCTC 11488 / FDC 602W) TaxID=273121 RepID=Q7MA17_WOLSU|nr:biopolymer transporter ExbD [Wolinella succinogenes]CAE09656.1 EXBD\TOLR FAMILY TRANSPORT PROTEIN [Wolinella succinogenes]VEG81871.1 Biopolymer transport protein exbD [Wolinella succinogenes]
MDSGFNWDETPDLNITPLVDIMLVLLAILMVTAPVIVYEEEISLPKGSKSSKAVEDAKIEIRVDTQRVIYIKENTYNFGNFSDNFVLFSNGYDKKTQVYIRADKNLRYDDVIFILKSVKEAGFQRVSLVTDG